MRACTLSCVYEISGEINYVYGYTYKCMFVFYDSRNLAGLLITQRWGRRSIALWRTSSVQQNTSEMPEFLSERTTTTTKRIVRALVLVYWAVCRDYYNVLPMKPCFKGQLSLHRDLLRAHPVCSIMFVSFSALSPRAGPLKPSTVIITIGAVYHCYQKSENVCGGTEVVKVID